MSELKHVVVTGGAGYIGSLLTGELLRLGYRVTAIDSLLYGGEALVPFLAHPNFHFAKADVSEARSWLSELGFAVSCEQFGQLSWALTARKL